MPTAELLKPARLNYLGRVWERGVQEPVDLETARILEDNPRFRVRGFAEAEPRQADTAPVRADSTQILHAKIRDAVDRLDVDDEEAFSASGKPQPAAVSAILGYDVTAEEIDAALANPRKPAATAQDLDMAAKRERKSARQSGVKITRVPREKAEKALEQARKADADDVKDPTTDDALEV